MDAQMSDAHDFDSFWRTGKPAYNGSFVPFWSPQGLSIVGCAAEPIWESAPSISPSLLGGFASPNTCSTPSVPTVLAGGYQRSNSHVPQLNSKLSSSVSGPWESRQYCPMAPRPSCLFTANTRVKIKMPDDTISSDHRWLRTNAHSNANVDPEEELTSDAVVATSRAVPGYLPSLCPSPRPQNAEEEFEGLSDKPYAKLIWEALMSVPGNRMMLSEIYDWFSQNTTKPQESTSNGWQNSIRHNLSMNQAFVNDKREFVSSRGFRRVQSVWMLTKDSIQNGVQSTTRYRKSGRVKKRSSNTVPDFQRQRSGAKGGRAARRSARWRQSQGRKIGSDTSVPVPVSAPTPCLSSSSSSLSSVSSMTQSPQYMRTDPEADMDIGISLGAGLGLGLDIATNMESRASESHSRSMTTSISASSSTLASLGQPVKFEHETNSGFCDQGVCLGCHDSAACGVMDQYPCECFEKRLFDELSGTPV